MLVQNHRDFEMSEVSWKLVLGKIPVTPSSNSGKNLDTPSSRSGTKHSLGFTRPTGCCLFLSLVQIFVQNGCFVCALPHITWKQYWDNTARQQYTPFQRLLFRPLDCKAFLAPSPPLSASTLLFACWGHLALSGVPFFTPSRSLADGAVCMDSPKSAVDPSATDFRSWYSKMSSTCVQSSAETTKDEARAVALRDIGAPAALATACASYLSYLCCSICGHGSTIGKSLFCNCEYDLNLVGYLWGLNWHQD